MNFNLNFLTNALTTALDFCYKMTVMVGTPSYGTAIILLTIGIKMLMFPLMAKQVRSMQALKELQPQMQAIRENYKDDKEKLQKEMTALYKDSGINPLVNFLPLLIQMPILTAVFYTIRGYTAMAGTGFLWLPDLARGASIAAPSDPYFFIPLLCAMTTYLQQRQTAQKTSSPMSATSVLMPAFIGYMAITLPAGLGLYWVSGNIIQLVQQRWIA